MSNIYIGRDPVEGKNSTKGQNATKDKNYYFISYKSEDAERIGSILEKLTAINVWYDYGVEYGKRFEREIFLHIEKSQAVILFVSNNSFKVADDRIAFVRMEYEYAREHEKDIIIVYLEKIDSKQVPASLWAWYQDLSARESVLCYACSTEKKLIDSIYNAVGVHPKSTRVRGKDIFLSIELTPEEAQKGCQKTIDVGRGHPIQLYIPCTVKDNDRLHYQGAGQPGHHGGNNGDLFITVKIKTSVHNPGSYKPISNAFSRLTTDNLKRKELYVLLAGAIVLVVAITVIIACFHFGFNSTDDNLEVSNDAPLDIEDTHDALEVGDIISFGTYEQDNNSSNGSEPIEWRIMEKTDDDILVLSKYILDIKPYNEKYADITWENSTLRNWLNNEFYNAAFSSEEQDMIRTTYVVNDDNPDYGTDGGNDTYDKVFLLSLHDVMKYFYNDRDLTCMPTAYAQAQGIYNINSSVDGFMWWVRSPGSQSNFAAAFYSSGHLRATWDDVLCTEYGCVRPAMWINSDSLNLSPTD